MKKLLVAAAMAALLLSTASAYNPPVGAEDLCLLSSPRALSGGLSVTGGAIFAAGAESIVVNPALTASSQRTNLNFGYTLLATGNDVDEDKIGTAVQSAIMIPFKLYVFSGYVNGTFANFNEEMYLGNSVNGKIGLSKEITDKLNVGASVSGGAAWKHGNDWALGFNLGFLYNYGNLGFLRNFRYGASVLNLGKNYNNSDQLFRPGINKESNAGEYPGLATIKLGAAGSFVKNDNFELGAALDFTVPAFQNLIVDMNLQAGIKNMLFLSIGEKFNVRETIEGHKAFIPSVGLIFNFTFDVKNNEYFAKKDWSQSEMIISAGYKNMYDKVNAISAGLDVNLGMKDTSAPEIILIGMDE